MRSMAMLAAATALIVGVSSMDAAELSSGVQVGGRIKAYKTTKCGGAEDGVKVGKSLCYTWRLGGRPVVFIFARTADDSLASLAKQLDKVVEENKDKKLAAVINFIGDKDLGEAIKKFGEKHGIKNTALTVSDEKNAKRFQVTSDADVTVMHYKGKKVLSNQAVAKGGLNKKSIAAIIAGSKTILK